MDNFLFYAKNKMLREELYNKTWWQKKKKMSSRSRPHKRTHDYPSVIIMPARAAIVRVKSNFYF